MFFQADTLDDLLHHALGALLTNGVPVEASRGANRELSGVLLKLTNSRARLSHTERRGLVISPLGELAWYLAGSNDAQFVGYYMSPYLGDAEEDGTIHGAYGPRLFNNGGIDQVENVIARLRAQPTSRKAAIQLFHAGDLVGNPKDIPCTCSLHFLRRGDRLEMATMMRSNDAFVGLPHDVFTFTMLQELIARSLGCEPGGYSHFASSLHLYDRNAAKAQKYLDEGWQGTIGAAMPPMPVGDPWASVAVWLAAEQAIRTGSPVTNDVAALDPYWQDLVRLLQVYRCSRDDHADGVTPLREVMACRVYDEYIAARVSPPK
jgi:thymidylate synthase